MQIFFLIIPFFLFCSIYKGLKNKNFASDCHNFDKGEASCAKGTFMGVFAYSLHKYSCMRPFSDFVRVATFTCFLCVTSIFSFAEMAHANNPVSIDPSINSGTYSQDQQKGVWRLRIFDAAIVKGDTVLLGEIAEPLGDISDQQWQTLAQKELWAAPNQVGRPFQINKQRLLGALRQYIGMYADSCILPNSLAIQKGGAVIREEDLRRLVIQRLSPQINALGGHSDITDYRLPSYIFVAHASQQLILEQTEVKPGRVSVRFGIQEIDGSIVRRFSGTIFLNLWVDAPALVRPLSKGDALNPADITYRSVNLAYENGELWDGRGGPWQLARSLGALQPIASADLQALAAIHKGDKVVLRYEKGNIRLSVVVEAMEDGGLGDLILLKNLETKKQIYGMVKDQQTVISK